MNAGAGAHMTLRALGVWCLLLLLAVVNGGVRDTWLSPRLGDPIGRAISTLLLCGLIFLATWLTIGWIRPTSTGAALGVGALWVVLTLAFEFGVGHHGFGKPWPELLRDYDLSRGRIWILVLVVTLLAPLWTARLRGLMGAEPAAAP
jgi:hypothetical protein